MAENYGSLLPMPGNGQRILEAKILLTLNGGGSGGTTGNVASGTATDPNTAGLSANVQVYNQFDAGKNFIRQWLKNPAGTFV